MGFTCTPSLFHTWFFWCPDPTKPLPTSLLTPASSFKTAVPNLGTKDWFHGKQFFYGLRWGWLSGDDSSALHLLFTLSVIWCCRWSERNYQSLAQRSGTSAVADQEDFRVVCLMRFNNWHMPTNPSHFYLCLACGWRNETLFVVFPVFVS